MRHGLANVLLFACFFGYPVGMNRQALYMFKWKRSESRWWCIKMSTIRGEGRYDDGDVTGVVF